MKVAIIGSTGQLGSELIKVLGRRAIPLTHEKIKIDNLVNCSNVLEVIKPDITINCAAYVKVDDAEDFVEEAFRINAIGARNVSIVCNKTNSINVYISTDYVFDGRTDRPYVENDIPNPINTYGISKYVGELFTKNFSSNYYIIRTSSLYGIKGASGKGGNFVETMIQKAKNGEKISVVDDMIISPTYSKDLAYKIKEVIEKKLDFGIYHLTNSGYCSWYEFAKKIFDILKLEVKIVPVSFREYKTKANRPKFSALESTNISKMRSWDEALKAYLIEKGHLKLSPT